MRVGGGIVVGVGVWSWAIYSVIPGVVVRLYSIFNRVILFLVNFEPAMVSFLAKRNMRQNHGPEIQFGASLRPYLHSQWQLLVHAPFYFLPSYSTFLS
jgi:hypothetical protein